MDEIERYRKRRAKRIKARMDAWEENDHPRDENGRFTSGGGGSVKKSEAKGGSGASVIKSGDKGKIKGMIDKLPKGSVVDYGAAVVRKVGDDEYEELSKKGYKSLGNKMNGKSVADFLSSESKTVLESTEPKITRGGGSKSGGGGKAPAQKGTKSVDDRRSIVKSGDKEKIKSMMDKIPNGTIIDYGAIQVKKVGKDDYDELVKRDGKFKSLGHVVKGKDIADGLAHESTIAMGEPIFVSTHRGTKRDKINEITKGRTYEQLGRRELMKIAKLRGMDTSKYDKEKGNPPMSNQEIAKEIKDFEKRRK